jgi:hypothetical protein
MILGNGNLSKQLSTGNKLMDVLGGGIYGLANATQNKGQYVPIFNWQGNGIARGGLQYLANPDYTNMYDAAQASSASLSGRDKEADNKKPSELFNSLFNTQQATYPLRTTTYNLPQVGNIGGGTIGDYGNAYNSFYDYSLPTQQTSFKLPWE